VQLAAKPKPREGATPVRHQTHDVVQNMSDSPVAVAINPPPLLAGWVGQCRLDELELLQASLHGGQ